MFDRELRQIPGLFVHGLLFSLLMPAALLQVREHASDVCAGYQKLLSEVLSCLLS